MSYLQHLDAFVCKWVMCQGKQWFVEPIMF